MTDEFLGYSTVNAYLRALPALGIFLTVTYLFQHHDNHNYESAPLNPRTTASKCSPKVEMVILYSLRITYCTLAFRIAWLWFVQLSGVRYYEISRAESLIVCFIVCLLPYWLVMEKENSPILKRGGEQRNQSGSQATKESIRISH